MAVALESAGVQDGRVVVLLVGRLRMALSLLVTARHCPASEAALHGLAAGRPGTR